MIDMHDVIAHVESTEVVECQLFALVHRTPEAHPVETVEYFMVGVAAYLVLRVDESVVEILAGNELRYDAAVLQEYGTKPSELGLLLTGNVYLVLGLHLRTDVGGQEFEVLVEYRLGRDGEYYCTPSLG